MSRKFLPIGTVVKLKEVDRLAIIAGYFPKGTARGGYVWDYSAFPFPEGMIDNDKVIQFDNEAIERVLVMGYQDEQQMKFIRVVMQKADEIKSFGQNDSTQNQDGNSEVSGQ